MNPTDSPSSTRRQAAVAARALGVTLQFAWSGIAISDGRLGVAVVPQADGRLGVKVTGTPGLTGFDQAALITQDRAHADYAPDEVRLEGTRLRCEAANFYTPALREGFTLDLEPPMAACLAAWLPRLRRTAELAAQLASTVRAHAASAWGPFPESACASLVATVFLDGLSVPAAQRASAVYLTTLSREDRWHDAFTAPDVQQLLEAVAEEGGHGRLATTASEDTP